MDRTRLQLSMTAEPGSVRLLRHEVLRWLREQRVRNEGLAAAVGLACSEAVANVVRHAYGDGGGKVEVEARRDDDEILVEVSDRGGGLAPGSGTERTGGMGLPLIGSVADGLAVFSNDDGTTLAMRFDLERKSAGSGASAEHESFRSRLH